MNQPQPPPSDAPYLAAKTAEELTGRNVQVVARLDHAAQAKRTPTDCVVDSTTGSCGRMAFV